ncbi:MAG: VCBS repeat-containing protein [Deltaproteobacteria bacterium]|nr:VCBS repeat-containing protein [Deltaproteobacteria bacterium]
MSRATLLLFTLALGACADKDGDDSSPGEPEADEDGDGAPASLDCDDGDPSRAPGLAEVCDGLDNNCDDAVDEGVGSVWYADADADGFGDDTSTTTACEPPEGFTAQSGDCDDGDATVYPDAAERCEGLDNDCDGAIDEDVQTSWFRDGDSDGHGDATSPLMSCDPPAGYVSSSDDCDDTRAEVSPSSAEICDELDNNCDGSIDEGVTTLFYLDADGDRDGDASSTTAACSLPAGYAATSTDCDDNTASVNPGADELCDGLDNNCDSEVDEDSAIDAPTWYIDDDQDGYGSTASTKTQCSQPSGYTTVSTDCDDSVATIHPGATESCDGIDTDCDGTTDEDDAIDAELFYKDADGDTYGDPSGTTTSCSLPSGYANNSSDCDDGAATVFPGSTATETPNDGIDQDCDGQDACTDLNCDGLPDLVLAQSYTGSSFNGSLYLYMNEGGGNFSASNVTTLSSSGSQGWDVADLDRDGYQDVVIANYTDGSTNSLNSMVYWGSAAGYSESDSTALPTIGAVKVLIEDLNLDGWDDITFVSHYNILKESYKVNSIIYFGSASGFSTSRTTSLSTPGGFEGLVEDLDSDGYPDLIFCNYFSGSSYSADSYIYWGSASGYSSSDRTSLPTEGCYDVDTADFNADGYRDIAFAQFYAISSPSLSSVYYGSAAGYSTADYASLTTYGSCEVDVGDFNGDGFEDVVFGGYHTGRWSRVAYTMFYYGSALGLSSSAYDQLDTNGALRMEAEDLDRDGYTDLVVAQYYDGYSHSTTSYVYYGSATGMSSADRDSLSTPVGPASVAVGDVSGDGIPDIIIGSYFTSSWSPTTYSLIFNGSSSGYSSTPSVTGLAEGGIWGRPVLVGNTAW